MSGRQPRQPCLSRPLSVHRGDAVSFPHGAPRAPPPSPVGRGPAGACAAPVPDGGRAGPAAGPLRPPPLEARPGPRDDRTRAAERRRLRRPLFPRAQARSPALHRRRTSPAHGPRDRPCPGQEPQPAALAASPPSATGRLETLPAPTAMVAPPAALPTPAGGMRGLALPWTPGRARSGAGSTAPVAAGRGEAPARARLKAGRCQRPEERPREAEAAAQGQDRSLPGVAPWAARWGRGWSREPGPPHRLRPRPLGRPGGSPGPLAPLCPRWYLPNPQHFPDRLMNSKLQASESRADRYFSVNGCHGNKCSQCQPGSPGGWGSGLRQPGLGTGPPLG